MNWEDGRQKYTAEPELQNEQREVRFRSENQRSLARNSKWKEKKTKMKTKQERTQNEQSVECEDIRECKGNMVSHEKEMKKERGLMEASER